MVETAARDSYRIKFVAEPSFAAEVKVAAAGDHAKIRIESERTEKDATRIGFSLETAVTLVAIFKGLIDLAELAKTIYDWYERSHSNLVVLQTPFGVLEMRRSNGVTEEDVRRFLEAATKLHH